MVVLGVRARAPASRMDGRAVPERRWAGPRRVDRGIPSARRRGLGVAPVLPACSAMEYSEPLLLRSPVRARGGRLAVRRSTAHRVCAHRPVGCVHIRVVGCAHGTHQHRRIRLAAPGSQLVAVRRLFQLPVRGATAAAFAGARHSNHRSIDARRPARLRSARPTRCVRVLQPRCRRGDVPHAAVHHGGVSATIATTRGGRRDCSGSSSVAARIVSDR